jgi:hypothetical protein
VGGAGGGGVSNHRKVRQREEERQLKGSVLVIAYSALFNNVFESLHLLLIILYTYVAELQLPGNDIWLLSRTQSSG